MKTKFHILLLTALKVNSQPKKNTDEMEDVDSMFPQAAAVTLNKT